MAGANPVQSLQEEATCSICLEYYKDPVITKCGHHFCRSCITGCTQGADTALPCPECREICPLGELRPNRQLQRTVEIAKQLSVQPERPREGETLCEKRPREGETLCEKRPREGETLCEKRPREGETLCEKRPREGETLCEKHKEKLKLFCKEDEKLICVDCYTSTDHKLHTVLSVDEAFLKYKGELQDWLQPLRKEMEHFLESKHKEEEEYRAMRDKLESERVKIVAEFERLHQLLKDQEQTLLGRLREMDDKIAMAENSNIAKLSGQMSSLQALITEIEKKCEQPPGELLKDVRSTLSRCEEGTFQRPQGIRKKYKVSVTLDPDTAHPWLALSEDGRRVTETGSEQRRPDHPKRFTVYRSVLGREGFSSGRHYWELQLLREGGWNVGVARESVNRKGEVLSPEGGVWAVQRRWDGRYVALSSPPSRLSPSRPPLKLGLYLDYGGGRLSIYNADTEEEIYTFTGAAFTGTVHPYFWVIGGTDLRLL